MWRTMNQYPSTLSLSLSLSVSLSDVHTRHIVPIQGRLERSPQGHSEHLFLPRPPPPPSLSQSLSLTCLLCVCVYVCVVCV